MQTSFPIYILRLGDQRRIVFPEDLCDIGHTDFWEQVVSFIVAEHYRIPQKLLENLPYSQSRARVVGNTVYYGGRPDAALLDEIKTSLGNPSLKFVFDEHERRLKEEVRRFRRLIQG